MSLTNITSLPFDSSSSPPSEIVITQFVISELSTLTKKQLEVVKDPENRLAYLSKRWMEKITEIIKLNQKEKDKIQLKIVDIIQAAETPISEEILDCLILDPQWKKKVWQIAEQEGNHIEAIHAYVERLIHKEIKQLKKELCDLNQEAIISTAKQSLKESLKENLKAFSSTDQKILFLTKKCCEYLFSSLQEKLDPILEALKSKHFTKEEIAAKKLPGGRNMLKEFLSFPADELTYRHMSADLLKHYFKKEKKATTKKFQDFIRNDSDILKKFQICLPD